MDLAQDKQAISLGREDAFESVNKLDLSKTVEISINSFLGLGLKNTRIADKVLKKLHGLYGENLPYLIGFSQREAWFALFEGSLFVAQGIVGGSIPNNDYIQELETPAGYGKIEGVAWTLYCSLGDFDESMPRERFLDGTPFDERMSMGNILEAAAMYWFADAANFLRSGNTHDALDWLCEGHHALSLANGEYMWAEGERSGNDSVALRPDGSSAAARSALGRAAAQKRHRENRSMKAEVFAWLDANMISFKSMDSAAEAITKQQPVAFRTARDWLGDWKKQRSTGTP